jgi:hypothetical protein
MRTRALSLDSTPLGYERVEFRTILRSNEEFGIPFYGVAARKFAALDKQQRELLRAAIFDLTKGQVPSADAHDKIHVFLRFRDCAIPNLRRGTVAKWLRRSDLHPEARKLLELRADAAHKLKVDGILRNVDPETSRIFHAMTYANAGTGRLSSHSPNMQNLHREEGDTAGKFAAIMSGDIARIEAFGPVLRVLASCERALPAAGPVGARCFCQAGSDGRGRPLSCLWTRMRRRRALGPRLRQSRHPAAHFRGRRAAAARGAERFPDLDPDIDVRRLIKLFDERHPRIRKFWDEILACPIAAIKRPGQEIDCGRGASRIVFLFRDEFMTMQLPSGRYVSYPFAKVITREGRNGPQEALLFKENRKKKQKRPGLGAEDDELDDDIDDVDDDDHDDDADNEDDGDRTAFLDCRSGGQPGFWGGPLAENATQGVARDVALDAIVRLTAAGYHIPLSVHDEIVAEVPISFGSFEEFVRLALEPPDWAPEMPVAGKARFGPRLAKVDIPVEEWVTGDWRYIPLHKAAAPRKTSGARKPKRKPQPSQPTSPLSSSDLSGLSPASAGIADPLPDPLGAAATANAPQREKPAEPVETEMSGDETNTLEPAVAAGETPAANGKAESNAKETAAANGNAGETIPDWLRERERLRREQQQQAPCEEGPAGVKESAFSATDGVTDSSTGSSTDSSTGSDTLLDNVGPQTSAQTVSPIDTLIPPCPLGP